MWNTMVTRKSIAITIPVTLCLQLLHSEALASVELSWATTTHCYVKKDPNTRDV